MSLKNDNYLFKQISELKLSDFPRGIKPFQKYRNASDSLVNIFERESIDSLKLKKIYDIYGDEIILEYLNDVELKNKTNLKRSREYANRKSCKDI